MAKRNPSDFEGLHEDFEDEALPIECFEIEEEEFDRFRYDGYDVPMPEYDAYWDTDYPW